MQVMPQSAGFGAIVSGIDLTQCHAEQIALIRKAWLAHQVLAFPDQRMAIEDIERFALSMGPFGVDPYFESIPGHPHVAQVRREADEQTPIFAESWHSDWSFLASPPAATLLYGNIIPPIGGDTLFANQYAAWDGLSKEMQLFLHGKQGIHSARRGYSREGAYGEKDKGRSMAIRYSDSALATQTHPIARVHPETGRTALFVSMGYTIGIDAMTEAESTPILRELFAHQSKLEFVYRHKWAPNMLIVWDNRCVIHAATGGYQGHKRLLHRITVAERPAPKLNTL
jgi:taurine dioxygenase